MKTENGARPDQTGGWATATQEKLSFLSLLVVMTFTFIANLKHAKEKISVPA